MHPVITTSILRDSLSWAEYYATLKRYITSDEKPEIYRNDKMLRYTADNLKRVDHVLDTITIDPKLYNLLTAVGTDMIWLVLAEPWCGDVSQEIPALYTIASCSDRISFRVLLSDSHPEVLDAYLTAGSRSIPKLICLRAADMAELGTWGPRPAALQKIVLANKERSDISFGAKVRMVHDWYEADKTMSIQDEFIDLVRIWSGK